MRPAENNAQKLQLSEAHSRVASRAFSLLRPAASRPGFDPKGVASNARTTMRGFGSHVSARPPPLNEYLLRTFGLPASQPAHGVL